MTKCIHIFLTLTLVFVFSLSSCGKKENSSTWTNYSNSFFSFQYPSDWSLEEGENNISVIGPQVQEYFINLKVDFNPSVSLTLEDFISTVETQNQVEQLPDFVDGGIVSITTDAIGGQQHSFQTSVTSGDKQKTLFVTLSYFVIEPSIGIVITSECPVESFTTYKKTLEAIQNSFTFEVKS